jgi:hypothetical protein
MKKRKVALKAVFLSARPLFHNRKSLFPMTLYLARSFNFFICRCILSGKGENTEEEKKKQKRECTAFDSEVSSQELLYSFQ